MYIPITAVPIEIHKYSVLGNLSQTLFIRHQDLAPYFYATPETAAFVVN